jgi:hypothetical protein
MSTAGRNSGKSSWRRVVEALPMGASLLAVGAVWALGCAWSFQEQSAFAASRGFVFPYLLPLVIDGFAVASAGVSWAASLDARAAIPARLATVVAVGGSAASNGMWAWLRTTAHGMGGVVTHDVVTVVLGMAVPLAANLAFEVLLSELRRQVQRRRGLPPPVVVPYPRMIRLILAPVSTFRVWRALVLELTVLDRIVRVSAASEEQGSAAADEPSGREALPFVTTEVLDGAELIEEDDGEQRDLEERAREVIAGSLKPLGRRQLARELDVTEHKARLLLAAVAPARPTSVSDNPTGPDSYALAGSEGGR